MHRHDCTTGTHFTNTLHEIKTMNTITLHCEQVSLIPKCFAFSGTGSVQHTHNYSTTQFLAAGSWPDNFVVCILEAATHPRGAPGFKQG